MIKERLGKMIAGAKKHSVLVKIGYGNETKMISLGDVEIDDVPLKLILEKKDSLIAQLNDRYNKENQALQSTVDNLKSTVNQLQESVNRLEKQVLTQLQVSTETIKGLITR